MSELPIIQRAGEHSDRVAIHDGTESTSYGELLELSQRIAATLLGGAGDLDESRVAFLIAPSKSYPAVQWGIWRAGGIAVPLSLSAAASELQYVLQDAEVSVVVTQCSADRNLSELCQKHGILCLDLEQMQGSESIKLPTVEPDRGAMILYTSGTTSKPKGVLTTHAQITAQIDSLVDAWHWSCDDRIPLFLPLHHIHGIINILSCALSSGARVETFERFEISEVLGRVSEHAYTLFMAVPTIYVKLIDAINQMSPSNRQQVVDGFAAMRLMVSGSAALPASIHTTWTQLTGQSLLERYGMTEIGMALSNPYHGERRPGAVGGPLPNVSVRLIAEDGRPCNENEFGEIQVRGPAVFREYWNKPQATASAFRDGWFQTGDLAVLEDGYYRIMGRNNIDIIKSGGYKLSALEIEAVLLDHPSIAACAVVGIPDETWGETVAVAVELASEQALSLETLSSWSKQRMSHYKIPRQMLVVDGLPRNAMGKVTKKAVAELFSASR